MDKRKQTSAAAVDLSPIHDDVHVMKPKQNRSIQWWYMTPVLFAPVFPLIRIATRKNPALQSKLVMGAVATALVHGAWLITTSMDQELEEEAA